MESNKKTIAPSQLDGVFLGKMHQAITAKVQEKGNWRERLNQPGITCDDLMTEIVHLSGKLDSHVSKLISRNSGLDVMAEELVHVANYAMMLWANFDAYLRAGGAE